MIVRRCLTAVLATVLLSGLLAGCVTLLPKEKPVQLYRFGAGPVGAATAPAPAGSTFTVQPLVLTFVRGAAGDRILTVTGDEAAYINGARWVSSASTLFESAMADAFSADGGPARLLTPGEAVSPDYFLKVDVRTFDVRYDHGVGTAPTIVVQVAASLSRPAERILVSERLFSASVPAEADRGGAIAAAFNQAVNQDLGQMVKWVDAAGPPPPSAP
jgi:cholesterol transport system auxiliary component